jgi:hypothetical protein
MSGLLAIIWQLSGPNLLSILSRRRLRGNQANVEKSEELRKEKHEQLLQELREKRLAGLDGDLLNLPLHAQDFFRKSLSITNCA